MADDKIALSIEIEADRAQMSLGELEDSFEGLKEKLKATNRGTEEGRKAFKELSDQMALTTSEIKNIELGFEGLDREQIASEFGGMAGGIGDVTASLVLMGGENETIEQMGRSIEKAMAISMGLKGAIEGMAAANKLYTNVLEKTTVMQKLLTLATSGWGKALIATGIGAIIALITTLVVYWDDLTVAIGLSTKAQKLNNQVTQEAIDAVADEISASDKLQKILNDETVTREDKNKAIVALQDEYPNLLSNIDAEKDSLDDINEALILNTQLLVLRAKQEAIASLRAEEFKTQIKAQAAAQTGANVGLLEYAQTLTIGMTAQELANAKTYNAITASEKQVTAYDDAAAALEREIEAILKKGAVGEDEAKKAAVITAEAAKKAAEAAKASSAARTAQREKDAAAKKAAEEKATVEELQAIKDAEKLKVELEEKLEDLRIQNIKDEDSRALEEMILSHQREADALVAKYGQDTELIKELELAQKAELDDFIAEVEEAEKENKAEVALATASAKQEIKDQDLQDIEDVKQAKIAAAQEGLAIASQVGQAITDINNAVRDNAINAHDAEYQNAKKNGNLTAQQEYDWAVKKDKILKTAFEREKKANIAMGIINTAQSVLTTLASVPYPANIPLAVLAAIAGGVQVASIEKQKFVGSAQMPPPPSMTAPPTAPDASIGALIDPVSNTSTILGDQQVTVTETDITSTQNNVSVIEESATF